MKQFLYLLLALAALTSCNQQDKKQAEQVLNGEYPTESLPDTLALLFAPEFISTHLHERDFTMTPDGNEIYYSVMGREFTCIAFTKRVNGVWTKPQIAPFSGNKEYMDIEPFITPDGKQLMFMSTRPKDGQEAKPGWFYQNIWVMDRKGDEWSEPYPIGSPVNSDTGEYYPTTTNEGTLYFTREDGDFQQSIYRSKKVDGKYQEPEKLPVEVNQGKMQYNGMISPDESYLIVCSKIKDNVLGRTDYYISFRNDKDEWTPLMNMGPKVNFKGRTASSPSLTADGKYFVFSSNKRKDEIVNSKRHKLDRIRENALSAQNGNLDLYWIKTDFIEELRNKAYQK
jgi:Tol biopolymer transport system component